MAIQIGFMTMFAVALPIGPLLALLNNLLELRIDAGKLTRHTRRPHFRAAEDIGSWQAVIAVLTTLGAGTVGRPYIVVHCSVCLLRYLGNALQSWDHLSVRDCLRLRRVRAPGFACGRCRACCHTNCSGADERAAGGFRGNEPGLGCADAIEPGERGESSRLCVCIGSPCLRYCVHGASIGRLDQLAVQRAQTLARLRPSGAHRAWREGASCLRRP
jgi:hypothetical protein